jgi:hypothetical protein
MADLNHWNAWISDESNLKVNVAPDAELIAQALTTGYLQPRLKASGVEDWASWVVWYDMSELTLRPDRSDDAVLLYDRLEIDGDALRRETGFDEGDKPTTEDQALRVILRTDPQSALTALARLLGQQEPAPATAPVEQPTATAPEPAPPAEDRSPPDQTTAREAAAREAAAQARAERMTQQSQALHAIRFATGRPPELMHPALCTQHAYSCPFTHAAVKLDRLPRPGTSGTYEARLDAFGRLSIGRLAPHLDVSGFLTTISSPRSSNGFAHGRR